MSSPHPFDHYAPYVNVEELKQASARPLRKSFRVNTLKCSIDEFREWAMARAWKLDAVQWCAEGFFIEQAIDAAALGKDLLHQLGQTYMQEAASMLPVELLDPKPGEAILDLCAAPGSKTTQIAAKMMHVGCIVANDVQEKRLWTLRGALQRCGVTNTILTNKKGEWFGKQMTERFDRVLCDAPCSAQGVVRSDPKAISCCTPKHIETLRQTQLRLLEAAIHAAKIGGRIVYSTCTLTPEENEGVILGILEKFGNKIAVIEDKGIGTKDLGTAINNSQLVQQSLRPYPFVPSPCLRLWPQTFDTEGFFSAVLTKTERTREVLPQEPIQFREKPLNRSRQKDICSELAKRYGTAFMEEGETLFESGDTIVLTNEATERFTMPVQDYAIGLPFLKIQKDGRTRPAHELVTLRGNYATENIYTLNDTQQSELLAGKDTICPPSLRGEIIILWRGMPLGLCMAKEGMLKNWLPRRLIQQSG